MIKGLPAGWGMCSRTVELYNNPLALAHWKDTVAIGLKSGGVITLDGITGIQTGILSGHISWVWSLTFSQDGTSLVSGSDDNTIKLWDVQTGGVVKTFHGHTDSVWSVSISADCTMIASGSHDGTIRLWVIQTKECHCVIDQKEPVYRVRFSPTDPQCLMSVSGGQVWQWDTKGNQIHPPCNGLNTAFSPDGTQFVVCQGEDIVICDSNSQAVLTKFHVAGGKTGHCCFSPDGKHIAAAVGNIAYIWETNRLDSHPIQTFIGHSRRISSLGFSSTLISLSDDRSVKFWQIGVHPTNPVVTDPGSTSLNPARILSMTLQTKDGIAISSHSDGVIRIWDISTGLCKASSLTQAKDPKWGNAQMINSGLISVWYKDKRICVLGLGDGEPQIVDPTLDGVEDVRISGDGSKVFCLQYTSVKAWSILTGEVAGVVELELSGPRRSLSVDGSRVWVHSPVLETLGWDFGIPGSSPIQLPNSTSLHPNNTKLWNIGQSRLKDIITGKVVFQLAGRFERPINSQWDGQYVVAGYESGEVLILDFNHVHFK